MTESEPIVESTQLSTEADLPGKSDLTVVDEVIIPAVCAQCGASRRENSDYCDECGYIYASASADTPLPELPGGLIGGRYQIVGLLSERFGVRRYQAVDIGTPEVPVPVIVLTQLISDSVVKRDAFMVADDSAHEFNLPVTENAEEPTQELAEFLQPTEQWPEVAWERQVLVRAAHLSLPRLIDAFTEDGSSYLIEEAATGIPLWEAWDSTEITWAERSAWLVQIAEALDHLHKAGAIVEGLRPEMIVISASGQAILHDLDELLPCPLTENVLLKGGFYTAPELLLQPDSTNERADLYAFGALLHALLMGRELSELDFNLTGQPRSIIERCPDVNPYLARVLSKTFVREIDERFPTHDGQQHDPTGFSELITALEACRRNLDSVHFDVAAWSNTGIIRSGNEDAVAIIHSNEARLDDRDDFACIILADGMGGMESGEVAAAMAVQSVRQKMMSQPPFAAIHASGSEMGREDSPIGPNAFLRGSLFDNPEQAEREISNLKTLIIPPKQFAAECLMVRPEGRQSPARGVVVHQERIADAIRFANKQVYDASRYGFGGRGMGCTLEIVLLDGPNCILGHVGDSRVYHMRHGRLKMITHDQTLVSRLVELGHITEAEAETHPRRSELQQAIGGRSEVIPELVTLKLIEGDWLLVCSDGLSNQLHISMMESVLREMHSAEKAARRLINLALINGANDNATVAIVRVS